MNHPTPSIPGPARTIRRALLAGCLCLLTAGAAAAGPVGVVEDFLGAYRAGDIEKMISLYTEDVRFVDVSQRHELQGRDAMRESLGQLTTIHKEMDVEIQRTAASGGLVTVEVIYSGTLDCAALGQPDREDLEYSLPAVLLFEVEDGHIRSQTDYLDFHTFTETFAALQPPTATK